MGLGVLILAACGAGTPPTATLLPTPTANYFEGVPGIVDPFNFGWPRVVEGANGRVTIPAQPQRIITGSIGHDEVTYALVPFERVVAVGAVSKDSTYSNVAALVQDVYVLSREPEVILAQNPDVIVTSIFFANETVEALTRVGIPVVQTALKTDPQGQVNSILFMGYIYGEEDRAVAFAQEIQARFAALKAVVGDKPQGDRARVMALASYADTFYTAGTDSTEGGIIEAAGGINAAAEAGLEDNPTISVESIIAMNPEVILITQPADSGEPVKADLLSNAALAQVSAIKDGRVYVVDPKLFTTLSYWNVLGAEELARLLWPEDLGDFESGGFSIP
jgi:iron complex transport system substrate-binding protein